MSNQLPQFEYEKAADFIPALSERLRESEAAMASIGNMISQNNSQRLANAEQFDKTINGVAKFSKSWQTILEKRRDKQDKIYANRATLYAHQAGANQRDLAEYNDNKDKFEKDVGYINALASQADANNQHELANYFRNLHGHELLIFKETLAKNAANNFERNFYNNIEGISIEDENGNKITWSMADGNQKIQLIDQYLIESGLDEVNGLRDDFLNDKFWPIVNRQKESILTTASKQDYNRRKAERAASIDDQLILAAETNTLGEKMLEIINTNYGDYKEGRAGARAAVIQNLDALLASGKISEEGYRQALDYSFTPDGWPENKTTTIGEHWSNDFGNIEDRIDQAKLKKYEARQDREKLDRLEFTFRIKQNLDGKPPTEQDVRDLEALWEEQHPGVEPPQYLKKLASMTVEDRIDDDIIKNLEYQFREGLPLTGIDGIYDAEKRETWQKRAASDGGQGLSKTHRQNRDATLKSAISTKTQETTGTTDKTVGYQIGLYNAKNLYNQYYHGSLNRFKTNEERHQYALEKTLSAINDSTYDVGVKNGTGVFEMQGPSTTMVYGQKIYNSAKYIHDYASENEGDINIIFTSILPDTESELLKLDNYAKDPTRSKIPVFYNQLASEIRTPGVTGWHIANAQYFAKYGKELPRPQIIDDLHNKSPLIQYMYTYYPNQRRLLRAQKMENNESFNTTNPWR